MKRNYQCNEFIYDGMKPDPIEVAIEKKVNLLYEMKIMHRTPNTCDIREGRLRKILSQYNSERDLTVVLHDVVFGHITLNTFLAQKGVMLA